MLELDRIVDVEQYVDAVDAVIFDMDDTLYAEKDYVRSGYAAVSEAFGQIDNMASRLWHVFEMGGKAIDTVLAEENMNDEKTKAKALRIYRFHSPNIALYNGVKELLTHLRARKKKLGIITDGRPEGQRAKLKALGLELLVDQIIVTDELGGIEFRKPNDTAFRVMQERMQVPFDRMMYVGDNMAKDFIAPKRLGMKTCHIIPPDGLYCKRK